MPIPARPKHDDARILEDAADVIISRLDDWLVAHGRDPLDLDKHRSDISQALSSVTSRDGYSLAKYLDDVCGWEAVDDGIVLVLSEAQPVIDAAYNRQVRAWVELNNVRPRYEVGDEVRIGGIKGTILGVNEEMAEYRFSPTTGPSGRKNNDAAGYRSQLTRWLKSEIVPFEMLLAAD